jgi:arylamine N-acetyltransferase
MGFAGSTYTDGQVSRYLERINFPTVTPPSFPAPTLDTLRRLVACHLNACPFENLSLHYSTQRTISLNPELLFDKLVNKRRGGYCMEQNEAFATLLRSLGYILYTVGGRVFMEGGVGGLGHMAIIVTLYDVEYLVDVGFGGDGLTAPLPIFNGQIIEDPIDGVVPERHRIHLGELPHATKKGHKTWMLQAQRSSECDWDTKYAFEKDFEFFAKDFEVYVLFLLL